jgi:hypothetical protein
MECTYIVPPDHRAERREERHFFVCPKCQHEEMLAVPVDDT